jgi:hypothetical protein
MAKKSSLTASYDALPMILRLILQIVLGVVVGGIYRIVRFVESKNIVTLIAGIIALVTGIGNLIAWIVDLVTLIINGKYTVLVD